MRKDNDNANYFISQLRIRIEMAFGMMSMKWGILQRPLGMKLSSVKNLMCCIARLHNFCIDERLKKEHGHGNTGATQASSRLSTDQLAFMHAAAEAEYLETISDEFPQWSRERDHIVKKVKSRGLERPTANERRKKKPRT